MSDKDFKQFMEIVDLLDEDLEKLDAATINYAASLAFEIGDELRGKAKIKEFGNYKSLEGKYIKIDKNHGDIITYVYVRSCFIMSDMSDPSIKNLCIQGVGFYTDTDNNFVHFSTWIDESIRAADYTSGKKIITEISYDDFKNEFDIMYKNLYTTFDKWSKEEI